MWVVYVEQMGEAMDVQWYQVQAVLNDLEEARTLLRRLVAERITVSGSISGSVVSISWSHRVEESADGWSVRGGDDRLGVRARDDRFWFHQSASCAMGQHTERTMGCRHLARHGRSKIGLTD